MMELGSVDGDRSLGIDAWNEHVPTSVFIWCGSFCVAVDRKQFLSAVKAEFGLEESIDRAIARLFEAA